MPLPIEPKPIMTMGPEIFAWIGEAGLIFLGLSGKVLTDNGGGDQALRRLAVTSISTFISGL